MSTHGYTGSNHTLEHSTEQTIENIGSTQDTNQQHETAEHLFHASVHQASPLLSPTSFNHNDEGFVMGYDDSPAEFWDRNSSEDWYDDDINAWDDDTEEVDEESLLSQQLEKHHAVEALTRLSQKTHKREKTLTRRPKEWY